MSIPAGYKLFFNLHQALTADEFCLVLTQAPEFTAQFNTRIHQIAVSTLLSGGGAMIGTMLGFALMGPLGGIVGAAVGASGAAAAGAAKTGAKQSDLTLVQLIDRLNPEQRSELWSQVQAQLGQTVQQTVIDEFMLRQNFELVGRIVSEFLNRRRSDIIDNQPIPVAPPVQMPPPPKYEP